MYRSEEKSDHTGWGVGTAAIIGAAAGYWAGKSSAPNFGPMPYAAPMGYGMPAAAAVAVDNANSGCRTCYQQGIETGSTMAGLNYIGQRVAANASDINNYATQIQGTLNTQFQAIQNQFAALNQQKINDLQNEVNALRTQSVVNSAVGATNLQLASISDKVNSIVTGCGVRSYPGCPAPAGTCPCSAA